MYKMISRRGKSADFILPAPVGGLNKRDPIISMNQTDAMEMDNYMPLQNSVQLREGYEKYALIGGFEKTKKVETLVSYHTAQTSRMIAVFGGKAYRVTKENAIRYENVAFAKSRCQTVQYQNRLYLMNGVDAPKVYFVDENDAEHFENWAFEGENLPENQIISAAVSHEFLWFVEKNSTRAWVSTVAGNIAGTLKAFDVAQVLKWGGCLQAVFNWTVDGGQGIDDYTCLLSSEGEVLIYKGYNPNDADNWTLVGSYKLGKPVGYQCTMAYQGDVVIICEDGYVPLSKALSANNAGTSTIAFSDKIKGLVSERIGAYKNLEGWQSLIFGKKGYAIFNVPVANSFEQHVININTGAWCKWTNIRAFCWCLYDGELYFGSDNSVFKFGGTYSDNGMAIEGKVMQAYSDLGTNVLKKIPLLKPKIKSSKNFKLKIWTNMDYEDEDTDYYVNIGEKETLTARWNEAKWNEALWQSGKTRRMQGQWVANSATGFKASVVFKTSTSANLIEWFETGLRVETGTGIL
ncbi:MAG TPA: hypothetical protein DIC64_04035 [Alphaproteobacteria bacterium]|nr:hypothetical protein [Alphaproteobacteria bacterium]